MRNPNVKAAAAAVLVLFCVAAFILWRYMQVGALPAQALAQVEPIQSFQFQIEECRQGQSRLGMPEENSDRRSTAVVSNQYGWRADVNVVDQANPGATGHYEQYVFPQKKLLLALDRARKSCRWTSLEDQELFDSVRDYYHPDAFIQKVLRCKYQRLGRKVIDGVEAEGFQTTDPSYCRVRMKEVDVKLWVDVRTRLPVRFEEKIVEEDSPNCRLLQSRTVYGFQWNVPVAARDFEPVIPPEYEASGPGPIAAHEEYVALEGLRACALFTGRYPAALDSQLTEIARLLQENPTSEAPNVGLDAGPKKTTEEKVRYINWLRGYYQRLYSERREPVYYGKVVKPGQADRVLLRWRLSPEEYRVVFGDLRAETVAPAKLAQLEAGPSQ